MTDTLQETAAPESPCTGATIQYYRRRSYGRTEDIATGDHADDVRTLTRRKTMTPEDMTALRALGCCIERVQDPTL